MDQPKADEIPLTQWCEEQNVPYTTALRWAKSELITARRRKQKRTVQVERTVKALFVPVGTIKPE